MRGVGTGQGQARGCAAQTPCGTADPAPALLPWHAKCCWAQILSALADFGHYEPMLFDDIGDSIAYANHYLAPIRAPVGEVAKALATYAKHGHERADLFVVLAR